MTVTRCAWGIGPDPLYIAYHDEEWGVPVHDDRLLFEFLVLEGAQAGLSWATILRRREGYRAAFDGFDVAPVAVDGHAPFLAVVACRPRLTPAHQVRRSGSSRRCGR